MQLANVRLERVHFLLQAGHFCAAATPELVQGLFCFGTARVCRSGGSGQLPDFLLRSSELGSLGLGCLLQPSAVVVQAGQSCSALPSLALALRCHGLPVRHLGP